MPEFTVVMEERWVRSLYIDADTLAQAKDVYNKFQETGEDPVELTVGGAEYLEDLPDTEEWYDEKGNQLTDD